MKKIFLNKYEGCCDSYLWENWLTPQAITCWMVGLNCRHWATERTWENVFTQHRNLHSNLDLNSSDLWWGLTRQRVGEWGSQQGKQVKSSKCILTLGYKEPKPLTHNGPWYSVNASKVIFWGSFTCSVKPQTLKNEERIRLRLNILLWREWMLRGCIEGW